MDPDELNKALAQTAAILKQVNVSTWAAALEQAATACRAAGWSELMTGGFLGVLLADSPALAGLTVGPRGFVIATALRDVV